VLGFLNAKDKTVRFRSTQLVAHIVNSLTAIDDDIFNLIRLGVLKRLRDKEPSVRVQAILCLGRFVGEDEEEDDEDSDEDVSGGILEKLLDIMINDPSAEVRRAVLLNLPMWPTTLRYILERARDMDATTRRLVYGKILPALGDFRHMSLVEREKMIRWGLRDRDDSVRKAAARLFRERWLEDCASSRDNRPEEEKKAGDAAPPDIEALCELLERIDVTRSGDEDGMAHEAMREFWDGRPDYREALSFDHEFWKNLDAQTAFIARTFNDYCHNADDARAQDMIEDKMPEVTMFAFVLQKELNSLMELVQKGAVMEEDDPEAEEVQEDAEEQDFIVQQLLHIAMTLDYTDEMGRRQMYNIMRESIAKAHLPEECTKLAIEVLRTVCGSRGESDFCALILEAIAEVRDSLQDVDDDAAEKGDDGDEESFHSAQSDVEDNMLIGSKKNAKEMSAEEQELQHIREVMVYSKCLHIAQCTLQNVHCDLESDSSLTNILNTLIVPAVQARESMIRERGVICLGLASLLSKDLAMNNLELFFHCFKNGHDALKEIIIQTLTDTFITHPQLLAPPAADPDATAEDAEPKPNPWIKFLTRMLLKAFNAPENKRLNLIACTAASKLLLLGILPSAPTAELLKAFTLTYFDPETATNPAVRQALSYFLPVFSHSKLKNAHLMAQIAVPIVSKLLLMREETLDEEIDDMVAWPIITAHLAEWTDGRKVVGATELGLDGKTSTCAEAEEPHMHLSIEILERALTNTCSKDERKPLLSLLSKLFIAPSSTSKGADEESLSTLHALVQEAVQNHLGTDATQRNFLAKLDQALNKRIGEVEHVTQVQTEVDVEPEETVAPEMEADEQSVADVDADATELPTQIDEEDEDTMLAGMQGEGTRMPLEDEDEESDEDMDDESTPRVRPVVTEDDIMESLLASEM
jgi:condensin complex subunit 3